MGCPRKAREKWLRLAQFMLAAITLTGRSHFWTKEHLFRAFEAPISRNGRVTRDLVQ
jgi:hypothetical protein